MGRVIDAAVERSVPKLVLMTAMGADAAPLTDAQGGAARWRAEHAACSAHRRRYSDVRAERSHRAGVHCIHPFHIIECHA